MQARENPRPSAKLCAFFRRMIFEQSPKPGVNLKNETGMFQAAGA